MQDFASLLFWDSHLLILLICFLFLLQFEFTCDNELVSLCTDLDDIGVIAEEGDDTPSVLSLYPATDVEDIEAMAFDDEDTESAAFDGEFDDEDDIEFDEDRDGIEFDETEDNGFEDELDEDDFDEDLYGEDELDLDEDLDYEYDDEPDASDSFDVEDETFDSRHPEEAEIEDSEVARFDVDASEDPDFGPKLPDKPPGVVLMTMSAASRKETVALGFALVSASLLALM